MSWTLHELRQNFLSLTFSAAGKKRWCAVAVLVLLTAACLIVPPAQAREPDWTYSSPDSVIGSLAISSTGDLIAATNDKVLFLTRTGALLGKEPFGSTLVMTPDGKYTASEFSSFLYFFDNPDPAGTPDQQKATKAWEYESRQKTRSLSISNDGIWLVTQTPQRDLLIFDTRIGTAKENTGGVDSVVKISPDGRRIIGISQTALHSYSKDGDITRTSDLTAFSVPQTMLLDFSGSTAFFPDGQLVRCVNTTDGKERWTGKVSGFITSLSITPEASSVIAGTESGTIAAFTDKGTLSWTYAANPEDRPASGITASAVSDYGALTAAGTADGRILVLNARGELTDSYPGKDYIRYVAVSGDGSTITGATDHTVLAFTPGITAIQATAPAPSPPIPAVQSSAPGVSPVSATLTPQEAPPLPMDTVPAAGSLSSTPKTGASEIIPLLGIVVAVLCIVRRR